MKDTSSHLTAHDISQIKLYHVKTLNCIY